MRKKDKPDWFPENPYKTDEEWEQKSTYEQVYEEAMEDILNAYLEHEKKRLTKL